MEPTDTECPVCGRTEPTNAAGVSISCCSRLPPLPVTAEEHSSIVRVLRERVDEVLVACAGHLTPSPLLGCALAVAGLALLVLVLLLYAC